MLSLLLPPRVSQTEALGAPRGWGQSLLPRSAVRLPGSEQGLWTCPVTLPTEVLRGKGKFQGQGAPLVLTYLPTVHVQ